jgi:hypothetical protein
MKAKTLLLLCCCSICALPATAELIQGRGIVAEKLFRLEFDSSAAHTAATRTLIAVSRRRQQQG